MTKLLTFRKGTPDSKGRVWATEARQRLAGELGMAFIHAGVTGLPLFWVAHLVYNAVMGTKDEPADLVDDMRAHIINNDGPGWATALIKGPLDQVSGATMSNRVSLDDMWLRTDPSENQSWRDAATQALVGLAGPVPSLALRGAQAADWVGKGKGERALEQMVPSVFGNLLRAIRFAREGVQNAKGDTLLSPEQITKRDVFTQGLGFTPTKVQSAYDYRTALNNADQALQNRHQQIMDKIALAIQMKDRAGQSEALVEAAAFSKANPDRAINGNQIANSVRSTIVHQAQAINGVYINPKHGMIRRQFPDYNTGEER